MLAEWIAEEKYLRKLAKVNKDTAKFFKAFREDDLEKHLGDMSGYGYRPYCTGSFQRKMEGNQQSQGSLKQGQKKN